MVTVIEIPNSKPESFSQQPWGHAVDYLVSILLSRFPLISMESDGHRVRYTVRGTRDDVEKAITALRKGVDIELMILYGPEGHQIYKVMKNVIGQSGVSFRTQGQMLPNQNPDPQQFMAAYHALSTLGPKGTEALENQGFVGGLEDPRIIELFRRLVNGGVEKYEIYAYVQHVLYAIRVGDPVVVGEPDNPHEQVIEALKNMLGVSS
jgi:hypothetical protein